MKGMTIQLIKKTQSGTDPFGAPIYEESSVDVVDCLVGQPQSTDVINSIDLDGRRLAFVVGIPKTDTNDLDDWTDADVIIFGKRFRTIGFPSVGIEENIPLRWKGYIGVERYE